MSMAADQLDRTSSAKAETRRRAILARLASGEAAGTELATPFEMSLPAVSKHLKVLERAGLIARGRERQWRPARLEAGPLREVAEWAARYRKFGEGSYDRRDECLDERRGRGEGEGDGERQQRAHGDDA